MPGGIMIDFRRLDSSKERLQIDWTFPVYAPDLEEKVEAGRTTSGRAKVALPREQAIAEIRAPDRRPLLVVRECGFCKGTDDALLSRRLINEKTLIYARWFRCVKLPNHVLEQDHPFRNLFEGEHPPHLFLCRYDGSDAVSLDGQQTQAELWREMERLIELDYEGRPAKAVRDYLRLLDGYDAIDSIQQEKRRQLEEELDERGPKSSKAKRLRKQLAELESRRAELQEREAEVLDLGLRPLPEADGEAVPTGSPPARRGPR